MLTADTAGVGTAPRAAILGTSAVISDDALTNRWDKDKAFFGEATFSVTKKLDLTFGARISDKTGGDNRYMPTDAFRTPDPAIRPQGDPFAYSVVTTDHTDPDTRRHRHVQVLDRRITCRDRLMVYLTYAEGFTSASEPARDDRRRTAVPPSTRGQPNRRRPEPTRHRSTGARSSRTRRSGFARTGSKANCASTRRTSTRTGTACASRCCRGRARQYAAVPVQHG